MESQTVPQQQQERRTAKLPPYRVVLHNDDVNAFEDVIIAVMEITGLAAPVAFARTLEAHERGRSTLLVTHLERAELFVAQFADRRLTATAEPDN